jgi:tetratricopeptide (TPR) repeat protein/transcriptional regulator with XRE-family HTH domain
MFAGGFLEYNEAAQSMSRSPLGNQPSTRQASDTPTGARLRWGTGIERSDKAVKKAQDARPNRQLKKERELRGWSQNDVARQLQVDPYYVSRWERGLTVPSPYYRQQLCSLYGKNADELGLLPRIATEGQQEPDSASPPVAETKAEQVSMAPSPASTIEDPDIPLLFAASTGLVGRDRLLTQFKEHLSGRKQGVAAALSGLPGVGKTTLAAVLAHDPEIKAHFADGVLWAGLGPSPDVPALLSRWGALLGTPSAQAVRLSGSEEWMRVLRIIIGTRRLLLVIDDAWRIEAALAFKVGGPHCAYLLTTRFPALALQFAPEGATPVAELTEDDGMLLLSQRVPEVVRAEPESARPLVRAVGGLPLALTIAGNYLRTQAYGKQPRRIRAALARLQEAQDRLLLTRPSAQAERGSALSSDAPISLQTLIAVSEQHLSEPARHALRALSVFLPKPTSFSEEAALAVCGEPAEALDELSDAGLLESSGPGRYTLYQVLADYARTQLADQEAWQRLVSYMTDFVSAHTRDYELLEQESSNIIAALRLATSQEIHTAALVRGNAAFAPFLSDRGLHAQAEEFLLQAEQAARSLQEQAGLAAILYHKALILFDRGKFSEATTSLQEGLDLARRETDQERICLCLGLLGQVARFAGDYQQGIQYYQEGLALTRQLENQSEANPLLCPLLMGLGTIACEQGDYERAEQNLQEGLARTRQTGNRALLCAQLGNIAQLAFYQGDHTRAEAFFLEALEVARQIGYLYALTTTLGNLGAMAAERGQYDQAEAYQQESLQLARQLENPVSISTTLGNLGDLALKQGYTDQAEGYVRESLALARQIGRQVLLCEVLELWGEVCLKQQRLDQAAATFREIREVAGEELPANKAAARYGLTRVTLAEGQREDARARAKESLRIFTSIGNHRAAEVEKWLRETFS